MTAEQLPPAALDFGPEVAVTIRVDSVRAITPRFAPGDRVVLTGSPRAGKTELSASFAAELGVIAQHTDVLVGKLAWGEDSIEVATWFDAEGPYVIEGVTAERALRKWLDGHDDGKPCDVVVMLAAPVVELTKGQETLRKGIATRWAATRPRLEARGVEIR
jgi:hypothetical protein